MKNINISKMTLHTFKFIPILFLLIAGCANEPESVKEDKEYDISEYIDLKSSPKCSEIVGLNVTNFDVVPMDYSGLVKICSNSLVTEIAEFKKGKKHGKCITFYRAIGLLNGIDLDYKYSVITYANGKEEGEYIYYHTNGTILSKGNLLNGENHGRVEEFTEDGALDCVKEYKNGVQISSKGNCALDKLMESFKVQTE